MYSVAFARSKVAFTGKQLQHWAPTHTPFNTTSQNSTWQSRFATYLESKDAGTATLGEDVGLQEQTHLSGIGLLVVDTETMTLDKQGVFVRQLASRHISVATVWLILWVSLLLWLPHLAPRHLTCLHPPHILLRCSWF